MWIWSLFPSFIFNSIQNRLYEQDFFLFVVIIVVGVHLHRVYVRDYITLSIYWADKNIQKANTQKKKTNLNCVIFHDIFAKRERKYEHLKVGFFITNSVKPKTEEKTIYQKQEFSLLEFIYWSDWNTQRFNYFVTNREQFKRHWRQFVFIDKRSKIINSKWVWWPV